MANRHPPFHAEYWVYLLASVVIIIFGILLYAVKDPI